MKTSIREQTQRNEQALTLGVEGMSCASCVGSVEDALCAVPGVLDAQVNLATEKVRVEHLAGAASRSALAEAVRGAGYEVASSSSEEGSEARPSERARMGRRLTWALLLAGPIFLIEMGPMVVPGLGAWLHGLRPEQTWRYLIFALATVLQFGPGWYFYRKGWASLKRGRPDMNALVMIGTSAAYGYSVVATFGPGLLPAGTAHVYYEAAATIIALILAGNYMEVVAKGRASQAIRRLLDLQAKTARVLRGGAAVDVPVEEVQVGDRVVVRPGEKIPVDGEVAEGFAEEEVLAAAAAVETRSEHPLGTALVRAAEERGLALEEPRGFEAVAGHGVAAQVGGRRVAIGAAR